MRESYLATAIENRILTKSAQVLMGICSGLIADGLLSDVEIAFLRTWLTEHAEATSVWPGDMIAARIEAIMADGIITDDERTSLIELLQGLSGNEFAETGSASLAGPGVPYDDIRFTEIDFDGYSFCFTGIFFFGTRAACEKALGALGGIPSSSVTGKLDFLVVGSGCNEQWANTTYGRKIEAAIERKVHNGKPSIISEKVWVEAMKYRAPC